MQNIEECFEYFSKNPYRIVKLEIVILFGENYSSNKIKLIFSNKIIASTEAQYQFDNTDDYLVLKNKIELCLNNFMLNYRVLSKIAIIPVVLTIIFIWICVYTNIHSILFPKAIQKLIIGLWMGGSVIAGLFPPMVKIKRNLFPCTEFRIGQNELIENKNSSIRNFILSTLIVGIILGVVGNLLSDFLFNS